MYKDILIKKLDYMNNISQALAIHLRLFPLINSKIFIFQNSYTYMIMVFFIGLTYCHLSKIWEGINLLCNII